MGMVVRTNTMANNAFRQLGMNNSAVSKSLEKLSSGFRINRAGDDAAGLAISERMKAQIKGLDAASANAQDGISLVQTAEGALNEVHDMLNRMVELATKAANGVYTDSQRANYADEVTQLKSEINRIADSTNFNSLNLLDGTMSGNKTGTPIDMTGDGKTRNFGGITGVTFETGLDENIKKAFNQAVADAFNAGNTVSLDAAASGANVTLSLQNLNGYSVVVQLSDKTTTTTIANVTSASISKVWITDKAGNKIATVNGDWTKTGSVEFAAPGQSFVPDTTGKATIEMDLTGITAALGGNAAAVTLNIGGVDITTGKNFSTGDNATDADILKELAKASQTGVQIGDTTYKAYLNDAGTGLILVADKAGEQTNFANTVYATVKGNAANAIDVTATGKNGTNVQQDVTLQVGDTDADYNKLTLKIGNMHTDKLGNGTDTIEGIDITSQSTAGAAIDVINGAIDQVSKERSNLGAIQNRLEHTINNLDTTSENLSAANSRIRDTDMAKEMMNYTKMNVLVQSAQAMLAQANQQPQSVLQLLQ